MRPPFEGSPSTDFANQEKSSRREARDAKPISVTICEAPNDRSIQPARPRNAIQSTLKKLRPPMRERHKKKNQPIFYLSDSANSTFCFSLA
jgi:hypothetical protein